MYHLTSSRWPNKQSHTPSTQPCTLLVYEGKKWSHDQIWLFSEIILLHYNCVIPLPHQLVVYALCGTTPYITIWFDFSSISLNVRGCLFVQREHGIVGDSSVLKFYNAETEKIFPDCESKHFKTLLTKPLDWLWDMALHFRYSLIISHFFCHTLHQW